MSLARRATSEALARGATRLITMGCGDACPIVPGLQRDEWPLADPSGQPQQRVREIRVEIKARVWGLIANEGWWKLRPRQGDSK